jgi:flagellar export protein FliJ
VARFRFRAQVALDLRRREHEAAQRELARTDAERQRAQAHLEAAVHTLAAARCETCGDGHGPVAQHRIEWYRFWIVRLEQELAALSDGQRALDAAAAAARDGCLATRQRREALERLREKAAAAHAAGEAAAERKMIDELAARRFTSRRDRIEGA